MRRNSFAILHHKSLKVLDPNWLDALDLRGFTQLDVSNRDLCGSTFDFNPFVVSTLYRLVENNGVRLPDNVMYDQGFAIMDKHERLEELEEQDDDDERAGIYVS